MIEILNFEAAKMAQTWCYRLYFAKGWREAASGQDVRNSVGAASSAGKILPITHQMLLSVAIFETLIYQYTHD
jgi:hypothetical protein